MMGSQPVPLSQEVLAEFSSDQQQAADTWPRPRRASMSMRRSSRDHSKDLLPGRPLLLRRLSSDASHHSHTTHLSRRDSVVLGKRFSIGPWAHGGRVSFSGLLLPQPTREAHLLENTYRVGPDPGNTFCASRTQRILQATLEAYLEGERYSASTGSQLSQILADVVRGKVKDTCPPRYKLVCQVVVGQADSQGILIASRALLDSSSDDFAMATYQNGSLFTTAVVHGIYHD